MQWLGLVSLCVKYMVQSVSSAVTISVPSEIRGPCHVHKSKDTQVGNIRIFRYCFSTLLWPWTPETL